MTKKQLTIGMALCGLVFIQTALLARRKLGEERVTNPLLPGDKLTPDLYRVIAPVAKLTKEPACLAVYLIDPQCPGCNLLAAKTPVDTAIYWIVAGPREKADAFASEHRLPPSHILHFVRGTQGPLSLFHDQGIFGTPTQMAIDPDGRVLDIRLVRVVTDSVFTAKAICSMADHAG